MLQFIQKAIRFLRLINILLLLRKKYTLRTSMVRYHHGPFYLDTNFTSNLVYALFAHVNPVHYGEQIFLPKKTHSLVKLETEIVHLMCRLFGVKYCGQWTGLINGGASEGNFHALVLAKRWFMKKGYKKIIVLTTSFTHESVHKSAQILDLTYISIATNSQWGISESEVERKIRTLPNDEAICIYVTLGYKATGVSDNLKSISNIITRLGKEKQCIICIDAAFDGLVGPFGFYPLSPLMHPHVYVITFDFHKYAGISAPAGGILFRKELIMDEQTYKNGIYETRSMLPVISIWASLIGDSKRIDELKLLTKQIQLRRAKFICQVCVMNIPVRYYADDYNLSLLLVCEKELYTLFQKDQHMYPVRCTRMERNGKQEYLVKIMFLPHFDEKKIDAVLRKIRSRYA